MKNIIVLVFSLLYASALFSKGPVIYADSMDGDLIGNHVQYFEDTQGQLTINDILKNNGPQFTQNKKGMIDFGHTNSAYWLKFKIKFNENKKWVLALEVPWIGFIDFYKIKNGKIEKYSTGDRKKYSERQIDNRLFAFHITEPKETQYYFRFKAGDPLSLPLRIISRKKFDQSSKTADTLFAIYFGLLFAMITYNSLLYISTRMIHYFYYSCYLFCFVFFALNITGLDYVYLYPNYPILKNELGFNNYISSTAIFLLLFTKQYLEINKVFIVKAFKILIRSFLTIMVLTPFVSYYYLMKATLIIAIVTFIFLSLGAIEAYKEGKRSARFYFAAFTFLIIGGSVNILANVGIIPFTTLSNNGAIISSAFEAIVLAFGLADVINNLKKEALLKADQLADLNKHLEFKVLERTSELSTSLNETNSLLNNMSQAVFTVDSKGDVIGKVSKFSNEIFEQDILGKNIFSFLLKDTGIDSIEYNITDLNLNCIIGSDDLQWICLEDRFPKKITRKSNDKTDQILRMSYAPIIGENAITESVMYVVEDITKMEVLEQEMKNEKEKSKIKIQKLQEVVGNSKSDFRSFIRDSQLLKTNLKKSLQKNNSMAILRDVHTLKGNSRIYTLNFLSEVLHILESELKEENKDNWPATVDKIIENVDSYIEIAKEIFGEDVDGTHLMIDVELTSIPLKSYNEAMNKLKTISHKNNLPDIIECIDKLEKVDLKSNFQRFDRVIQRLSTKLEKDIGFELEGSNLFLKQQDCTLLNESFIHIIQNSADHGIEKKGIIKIELNQSKNNKIVTISDNGRGLDPKMILSIALNKGIINYEDSEDLNDNEIIKLIFKPGFSTKEMATEYSGRGIGMDVVKTNIEKLGGTIDLQSILGKGTSFTIKIPHDRSS